MKINLLQARRISGLSQNEVSEEVGVSVNTIINYEKEKTNAPAWYYKYLSEKINLSLDNFIIKKV